MENKNDNVFSKLDNQASLLEGMSAKFENVNSNNLFFLAKRMWDNGDYKTAQTYFNQVSMLNPLDWKAPLYASLCNFKGLFSLDEISTFPEQVRIIIVNTIKYVYNLDMPNPDKEIEMQKCLQIVSDYLKTTNINFFKSKKLFDEYQTDYIDKLRESLIFIKDSVDSIDLECVALFKDEIQKRIVELNTSKN